MRFGKLIAALALAVAASACGSSNDPTAPGPTSAWMDVPGMICADGSQTGIGISPGSADGVLVYLAGGGACWPGHCDTLFRAFGQAEFDLGSLYLVPGTILDRALPGNPFATWTIVFVPYCTGDVHAGDSVGEYVSVASTVVWNHHGYRNLQAAVGRMATEVAPPAQVVVAGSSAGGFGSLLAYDLVRAEWPEPVVGALVDDSGPTFVGTAIPAAVRTAWWDAWNLGSTVSPSCATCQTDLSALWRELEIRHPSDRLALISTTQDLTMRAFFGDPNAEFAGPLFEAHLAELAQAIGANPNAATFRVGGTAQTDHALLFSSSLATSSAGGTLLLQWLSELATGDPAWVSRGPP